MASPANSTVQNLLPVQAYFNVDGSFNTFIGQGVPFYATANPIQSGLTITNSTINSTTIGALVPSTAVFSSGQINATPSGSYDITNKLYVDSVAIGISWKAPVTAATLTNITLSGTQTVDSVVLVAGNTVLVKNQSNTAQNGIYTVNTGAWTYATGSTTWQQYVSALVFVEYGSQAGSAWYCTAQPGGTLGTTAMTWSNFSAAANYSAGTGLTLTGFQFSITNTGVSANTYGSASAVPVIAVNAQGQITSATTTTIAIANTQVTGLGTMSTQNANGVVITGGTLNGVTIGGTTAGAITATTFTGAGTGLTGTATSLSIGGTAALATSLAGGAAGSLPYQSAINTTTFLAAGTNGQVLTLASGVPSWATPTTGTVTSVSGTGTVNGLTLTGTVTTSGSLTLGGTLSNIANSALTNSSITFGATAAALGTTVSGFNAVTIGATTASTGAFTYLSTSSVTSTTPVLSYNASNCNLAIGASVASTYLQTVMQNKSSTAGASTNFAVSNNLGTDSTYYGEFGMNSSVFNASTPADFFSINNGIYFSGHDGDVTVGSGNGYKTYLAWGTTGQSAHVINATGAIGLNTNLGTTPAGSGTTNFGTSGQVLTSAGSGATPTWTTISSGITVTDDTTTNASRYLTFTSATSGTITGVNTSSTELSWNPSLGILDLSGATGSLNIPKGTTAQRPASPATSMIRFNTTTSAYEVYSGATNGWVPLTQGSYNYTATYLVVAGGGSGGYTSGGGGGGLLTSTATLAIGVTYTVTVGAGGASVLYTQGNSGTNSVISGTGLTTITAIGGGGGGSSANGNSGGSGGGGGYGGGTTAYTGGAGTSGQGFAGGNTSSSSYGSGGGGGASAVGGNAASNSGNGGAGAASSITGSSVYYAGGGGGGAGVQNAYEGSGGTGGGGNGGSGLFGPPFTGNPGSPGGTNTGGGGGGAYNQGYNTGAGGSGIVILSVPTANYSGTTTGSPTITTSGSSTIIKFTASGSYTA